MAIWFLKKQDIPDIIVYFSQFSHTYTYISIHYIYLDTYNNITYISCVLLCINVYIAHIRIPELREINVNK